MQQEPMDWRVDVHIDGAIRSFVYPSESVARKVLAPLAMLFASCASTFRATDSLG